MLGSFFMLGKERLFCGVPPDRFKQGDVLDEALVGFGDSLSHLLSVPTKVMGITIRGTGMACS